MKQPQLGCPSSTYNLRGLLQFRRQDWVPLLSTGYLMRDGGEDATATETCSSSASSRSPQACNFFEGFILGMHSALTSPPLDSHSFALFPTDVWICLGSKLLVLPMTKRDMYIFLIRHRRMAQRDLAPERSTATHPVCWWGPPRLKIGASSSRFACFCYMAQLTALFVSRTLCWHQLAAQV